MRQCCTNHNGRRKQKYKTQEEAENAAYHRKNEGETVSIYPCEDGDGWHLTSNASPPLERPIREMTIEERRLYTKKNKNLLGNSLDKWLLNDLKDKSEKNTLAIYEENIEQAQQELDKKKGIYQNNEKGFLEARKRLRLARQDLNEATLKLQNAQQEYSSEKSRIARKRR